MVRRSRERDRAACNASAPRKTAARRVASRHKRIGSGSSTPRPLGLQTHATTRNQFSPGEWRSFQPALTSELAAGLPKRLR